MNGTTHIKAPAACTPHELESFERMVRLGFAGSTDDLPVRIRQAHRLAFHYGGDGTLVAIAGLKAPHQPHREKVFALAAAEIDPAACEVELGWVYVAPSHRLHGLGRDLCRRLLADRMIRGTFAKIPSDNGRMKGILRDLGFRRSGRPFARRDEQLDLYLRP
jgi:GNAT superfamily N-acetyltransferase